MFKINIQYQYNKSIYEINDSDDNLLIELKQSEILDTSLANSYRYQLILTPLKDDITIFYCGIETNFYVGENDKIFLNGYQSWTDSREFSVDEKMRGLHRIPKIIQKKYSFLAYGDYKFVDYPYKRGLLHGFTYSYVRSIDNDIHFIGSLNDDYIYTIIKYDTNNGIELIESDISLHTLKRKEKVLDFIYLDGVGINHAFDTYKRFFNKVDCKKLIGYSSWYDHYENITEDKILKALDNDDFELIQIDDGYTIVGDWLECLDNKFPNGLKYVVDKIHEKQKLAGVWMAPFAACGKSKIFNEHKDWFIKDGNDYLKGGQNWGDFYILDLTNQDACNYISDSISHMTKDIGFDFLKLDFLYVESFVEYKDMFHAEALSKGLDLIRSACKDDTLILGCGVPLAPAWNKVEYSRIGADVSLKWDDVFYMKWMLRERVSTKRTILNTLYRSRINGLGFLNDPDVFLLRNYNNKLTLDQKKILTYVNFLCGGIMLTSDYLNNYDEETKSIYNNAKKLMDAELIDVYHDKKNVYIKYLCNDKMHEFNFNYLKGVIINE